MNNLQRVTCKAARVAPGRILVIPWGNVSSSSGDFVLDDGAAASVVLRFKRLGRKLVIDFEHQTMGGEFASPDGTAPAAGWIKALHAVRGRGIEADVEWNERAAAMIAAREYFYLSPVVSVAKTSRKVAELVSAGLTNDPAIVGMTAIVNRRQANKNGGSTTMLDALKALLASIANDGLSPEAIADKLRMLIDEAEGGEEGGSPEGQANRRLLEDNVAMRRRLADQEWGSFVAANSRKLPPAYHATLRKVFEEDPESVRMMVAGMPNLVYGPGDAERGGGPATRPTAIFAARRKYAEERSEKVVLCSERTWVSQALRDAGQAGLTDDEVTTLGIVVG